ncbi:GNAT family N-acetyltransferase [Helicobacter jaachi]|uniref:GNAT family N-acetyltransferase n=1 Tax=Helicobacter jaachi TaxID=1677920 RepID=A0A4U8T8P4_9HELI|nr:GNAT family N-acetyltransferase [Helicobacter jaachi]TLD96061.1 GNAT family N-acetyltransferase [Helicobacter jaachi]
MKKSQIRQRLVMKMLDTSHIEQFNELLRYAFQVTDSDLLFTGWSDDSIKRSKYPILQHAKVLGWFDKGQDSKKVTDSPNSQNLDSKKLTESPNDKLVSQIALYPMKMNIYNQIYAMGGITGVATYPEYSGIGLMADLMKEILKIMRDSRQSIACLYPYSIPYYRSRGFEIVSDKMTFSIKDNQFPKPPAVNGMMQRVCENHPDLIALHNEFASKTHGCLVRDSLAWNEYWRWDVEDTIVAIYYDESDKPTGYIVYLLENDIFKIKEMIYLNEEARHGLWGYIEAHKSMFERIEGANYSNHSLAFLLEDGHIKESISPYIMARIVDVTQFLERYPFDSVESSFTLCLVVSDPLLEWNNMAFVLHFSAQGFKVEMVERGFIESLEFMESKKADSIKSAEIIKLDIQTLSAMLLGYKRPLYLRSIGRLEASDNAINKLEEILPEGKAYFSDYF